MKIVYRSFKGKLNIDCQSGYIISESEDFYLVEFFNVEQSNRDGNSIRIRKNVLCPNDFSNLLKITELEMDIENGCADYGQIRYKGKWYSVPMIRKIQNKNKDGNWKKYI